MNYHSEAYILHNDPTRVFALLYSKYGDIDEYYNKQHIFQIIHKKKSHYSSLFKEIQYDNQKDDEFLKRFYQKEEVIPRIPKIVHYYRNYQLFFCQPIINSYYIQKLMSKYHEIKAEIFYKNHYAKSPKNKNKLSNIKINKQINKDDNNSVNNTIFDKQTRLIIEKETNTVDSLTLDSNSFSNKNLLYSRRMKDNSFKNLVNELFPSKNIILKSPSPKTIINAYSHNIKNGSLCNLSKKIIDNFQTETKNNLPTKINHFYSTYKANIVKNDTKGSNKTQNYSKNKTSSRNTLIPKNQTFYFTSFHSNRNKASKPKQQNIKSTSNDKKSLIKKTNTLFNCNQIKSSRKDKSKCSSSIINYMNMNIISNFKKCKNVLNKNINKNSVHSQRSTSNISLNNIKSESTFNSRNRKVIFSAKTKTISIGSVGNKSVSLNVNVQTSSIDEKNLIYIKNNIEIKSNYKKRNHYQISKKLSNQIDELLKRTNLKISNVNRQNCKEKDLCRSFKQKGKIPYDSNRKIFQNKNRVSNNNTHTKHK